jgi:hypothetical protein
MSKLIAFIVSSLFLGVAHAQQVKEAVEAPLPEPNYIGIIAFLVIAVACCIWYGWLVMRNSKKEKMGEE